MWPTVNGLRMLQGAEADLVRGATGTMVDHLVIEFNDDAEPWHYGIDLFDLWDSDQRLWLLEKVSAALLTDVAALPPAAIWEATVDAIFCEVMDLISLEIDEQIGPPIEKTWRQSVIDAFAAQHGQLPLVDAEETDCEHWRLIVTQVADAILGPASYQKAEAYRDGEIHRLEEFLRSRALPADFLEIIPPLRTIEQTQDSIDRLVRL